MQISKLNVLISGGTSGVGKATAADLAAHGANVTLIGRNKERGEAAVAELQSKTGNSDISLLLGDLSTEEAAQKVATEYTAKHSSLGILVNSLGNIPDSSTENITVNLLSHYWLISSLINSLSLSKDPRVFVVTGAPIIIKFAPINRFQPGKVGRGVWLLTHKTLLVRYFADSLCKNNIKVNAFFPGAVKSNLTSWNKGLGNDSASTISNILKNSKYDQVTGEFFDNQGHFVGLNHRRYNLKIAQKEINFYTK